MKKLIKYIIIISIILIFTSCISSVKITSSDPYNNSNYSYINTDIWVSITIDLHKTKRH